MVMRWTRDGYLSDPYDEFCVVQNQLCWNYKSNPKGISHPIKEGITSINVLKNHKQDYGIQSDDECINGTLPEFLWKFG